MKIAIIGAGRIGAGLGRAWANKHALALCVRDPGSAQTRELAASLGARAVTIDALPEDADVVVLAIPYGALEELLARGGLDSLREGTVVIDCTNAVGRGMTLRYGHTTSAAEELQRQLPRARVFKSFNAQGAENLANPRYGDRPASNFFCGDDDDARALVQRLVVDAGFDPVDAGPLSSARLLEPMMLLWIHAARSLGTRDLAFTLLRRP